MTFVPSLQKETKYIESFCFHSWKETITKDIPTECTYSIVHDEHQENSFIITSALPKGKKKVIFHPFAY